MGTFRYFATMAVIVAISGCALSFKEEVALGAAHELFKTKVLRPRCTEQCTATYSKCTADLDQVSAKTEKLQPCRETYAKCVASCPVKY